jgi:hypothetical protein
LPASLRALASGFEQDDATGPNGKTTPNGRIPKLIFGLKSTS